MDSYGILADSAIRKAIGEGLIKIEPYNETHVNPASYDLTLGDEVTVYKRWVAYDETFDVRPHVPGNPSLQLGISRAEVMGKVRDGSDMFAARDRVLDVRDEPETVTFKINPEAGWLLRPGIGYLMHTRERIWTESFVPIVDGKSSIGRLFMQIHATAGYGDPGFDGEYTLEVIVQHPVRVYPGMRIGQIRFHTMHGALDKTYKSTGHYTGEFAKGAVASQAWKQFKK